MRFIISAREKRILEEILSDELGCVRSEKISLDCARCPLNRICKTDYLSFPPTGPDTRIIAKRVLDHSIVVKSESTQIILHDPGRPPSKKFK